MEMCPYNTVQIGNFRPIQYGTNPKHFSGVPVSTMIQKWLLGEKWDQPHNYVGRYLGAVHIYLELTFVYWRNWSVICAQTVWRPRSRSSVRQYPSRNQPETQCFRSGSMWIRIEMAPLDPDPYWEYGFGSGSRTVKMMSQRPKEKQIWDFKLKRALAVLLKAWWCLIKPWFLNQWLYCNLWLKKFCFLFEIVFVFWSWKTWIRIRSRIRIDLKCGIRIRIEIKKDPKHCWKLYLKF